MIFKVGDKVKYIDQIGGGKILKIQGSTLTIEDEHGFTYEVNENQVIGEKPFVYKKKNEHSFDESASREERKDIKQEHIHHRSGRSPFMEIDLHIHHLVSDERNMTNRAMVNIQLAYARKMIGEARSARYTKLVFIHGVGTGVLKSELRALIGNETNCQVLDASFQDYGYGATEVRMWYN